MNHKSREFINFSSIFFMFNKNNRLLTFSVTFLFLLMGVIYLFLKTPTYKSYTSIELDKSSFQKSKSGDDLLDLINSPTISDIETQIDLIKSKKIILGTIEKLNLDIRYYKYDSLKKEELYPDPPFRVVCDSVGKESVGFVIEPTSNDKFKLYYKNFFMPQIASFIPFKSLKEKILEYAGEFRYGSEIKPIKVSGCSFKVLKTGFMEIGKKYEFDIFQKDALVDFYKKKLHITPSSLRSSLIKIELEESNPYVVRDFLNTLTKVYIAQNIEKRTHSASVTLNFINDQIENIKRKLQESAEKLKNFKKNSNIIDVDTKSRELMQKIIQADEQLARLKVDLSGFLILEKELRRGNYSAMIGLGRRYEALSSIVKDLEDSLAKRAELLTEYTEKHPEVAAINHKIENLKMAISNIAKGIENNLKNQIAELERIIKKYNDALNKLPGKEQQLANYERKYNVNEKLYSYLLERKSELSLAKASKVSDARVIDKATAPTKPYSPKKALVLLISSVLGLIFSTILILIKNRLDNKVKSEKELKSLTRYPVYGSVPYIENRKLYNKVYVLEEDAKDAAEAFRRIRADIEFMPTSSKSKVILVTSMVPKEGKTVIAANLAMILGSGEKKTLLLGLDLRKPEIHSKFNIPNKAGISDLFRRKAKFKEIVWQMEGKENLHIITAGSVPENPFDLIDSKYMGSFINKMREFYDYIVMEAPPVDMAPDALVLSKYADITIFAVKSEYSLKENITKINEITEKYKIKNPGFILHSVKPKYAEAVEYDRRYVFYQA